MMTYESNPYRSPRAGTAVEEQPGRLVAKRRLRWGLLALLPPAWANAVLLVTQGGLPAPGGAVQPLALFLPILVSLLPFLVVWGVASLVSLLLLECVAAISRTLLSRSVPREKWMQGLYDSLWRFPWAAGAGSLLWGLWLGLFYVADGMDGFLLSVLCGVAGHALGAWVYVPLLASWFRMRAASKGGPNRSVA